MSIKQLNSHAIHIVMDGEFPESIEHDGETYIYGTYVDDKRTTAVYFKKRWLRG